MTVERMEQGIKEGLQGLEEFTRNAEALAREMAKEDGLGAAASVLATEAAAARKGGGAGALRMAAFPGGGR